MRFFISTLLAILAGGFAAAQEIVRDSALAEVIVEGYTYDRPLSEVPAAIALIDQDAIGRFSNTSLVPAVNIVPGVRMEERSPGSYRFSIRGSTLRSPFGIRNVKIYWNGFPLTDAGGNTYLNLIDPDNTGSIEIIKGPGSSLYGAGTGGVVLVKTPDVRDDRINVSGVAGSYGLVRYGIAGQVHRDERNARFSYAHQQSEGYRKQSAMERDAFSLDITQALNEDNLLSANIFYTDLSYETPGGLTLQQFEDDPSQARPAGGPFGSAETQRAAVYNQTFFGGLGHQYDWTASSYTNTVVYGSFSDFVNPSIREYEERDETNAGLRTITKYGITDRITLSGGGEFQHLRSPIKKFRNNEGEKGGQTTDDDLRTSLGMLFAQVEIWTSELFAITGGLSAGFYSVRFESVLPEAVNEKRQFDPVLSPRIALLRRFGAVSAYASFSRGFSPPTLADLYPSTSVFDRNILAEKGNSLEAGLKGNLLGRRLSFDVCAYDFRLRNAIVPRRDAADAEYFVNAGKTNQRGIEAFVVWRSGRMTGEGDPYLKISGGYTYNHYRFDEYVQETSQGTVDNSGKKLTGVPPTMLAFTADVAALRLFYFRLTANYVDHIPLNDANTAFAEPYLLAGARAGYRRRIDKVSVEIFAGVDNALDRTYSLGNDLNALAGRYFNTAAPRNYYGGLRLDIHGRSNASGSR